MARDVRVVDGIEVTVSGFFTTHHLMHTQMEVLGELVLPSFTMEGVFHTADGRELAVRKTNWWRGWHEMRENGVVLGTAYPQGFWRRTTSVGFVGLMYELVPTGFWSQGWHLLDETGRLLAEIHPRGIFRRGAYLTVVDSVSADLLIFAYYLVNARWQEQSAAAGTAAAGS